MRRALVLVVVLAASVAALTLTAGTWRTWTFRAVVVAVWVGGLRAIARWHASQPAPTEAFRRRVRLPSRRRRAPVPRDGTTRLVELATMTAGDAHRGLRPVLQEIADERLRSGHGASLQDERAATLVGPVTWELVRPDRPPPHDLRSAGLDPAAVDAILDDLERL